MTLSAEGWSLKQQAIQELSEAGENLRELVMNIDLKKIGQTALPDDINRIDSKQLPGPYVLQIESLEDVSCPSKGAVNTSKQRMLLLKLTDGKLVAKAVELKPCHTLDQSRLPPGTKVQISNATVKAGVILLEDKSIKVLGGRVEELIDAWEFQRRFGGERPVESASADGNLKAPKFTPFVPGKTRAPAMYMPAAQAQKPSGTATTALRGNVPPGIQPSGEATQQSVRQNSQAPGRIDTSFNQDHKERPPVQAAAKQKLLDRLAESQDSRTGRGRGERRGRRRRGDDDAADDGSMTLAEFEAKKRGGFGAPAQEKNQKSDEELARQLQAELDLEDAAAFRRQQPLSAAEDLRQSLFSYAAPSDEVSRGRGGRRGRGRSRGRGGRGR